MSAGVWTSRDVHFHCFPRTSEDDLEAFIDAAVERYWETWRHRAYGTLSISTSGLRLEVGTWPWWVPKWFARRSVASLAESLGLGGDAVSYTARTVLP